MAREASEATEIASYERGLLDMEVQLVEEVVGVCRDYCTKVWAKVLNRVAVPANSELRSAKSIFFPKDIQEALAVHLPSE